MKNRFIHCLHVGSLETNCWIYSMPDEKTGQTFCAVIDPGADSSLIIEYLKKNNLCPQYILLTHGHFDHVTALPQVAKTFPDAVTVIHKNDASFMKFKAGRLAAGEETIGPFTVMHLPGHSPGSAAFYDSEGGILFSGDTLFHGDCGRTDLPGGSKKEIAGSLARLLAMEPGIRVLPGHGPETTIEKEASRGLAYFTG